MQITLSRGLTTTIDDIDADLANYKWCANPANSTHYADRTIILNGKKTTERLHRVILERMLGRPLTKGEQVDHKNMNGLDNRRENLRVATQSQNAANRTSTNPTGYKGVCKSGGRFVALIKKNQKRIYLGTFDTIIEAAAAYNKAAVELFAEFARLNDLETEYE